MSLFSWFSRKPAPPKPRPTAASETSGLLNADATVPLAAGRQGKPILDPVPPEHAANRKNERMERRELLYTVVRDAMVRAGVLSASYKFKVLSLDQRGRQFLVMMDLAREYGGETVRLSEIEALIAQTAKTRYDILVTAVYWRINDHVAVGIPQKGIAPLGASLPLGTQAPAAAVRRPLPPVSAPAPLTATPAAPLSRPTPARPAATAHVATAPAPLTGTVAPRPPTPVDYEATRPVPRFEPIEADEVAAFKRALADAAGTNPAPVTPARPGGAPVRSGPIRPRPPHATGFEDTEMPGAEERGPDLSSTQYGELR